MHDRPVLGLTEALAAMDAMIQKAANLPGRPMAIAVLDHHGDMICFAAEAGVNPAMARQGAFKKAYTSACMRVDTKEYGERMQGRNIAAMNPNFTTGAGGLVISRSSDGTILGGIGVSGRPDGTDEPIAQAGLEALKPFKL